MKNPRRLSPAALLVALGALTILLDAEPAGARTAPTFPDIRYGEHERHVLDVWLPGGVQPASPAPLVVYIHGGGFGSGDKNAGGNQQQLVALCRERGWIYAAINYRYAREGIRVVDAMGDGKRALQFLRHHAAEWGIDRARVALYGGSAGTGMSLWIGLQDDMADPANADPVLRESTRVSCIGMINGQITYDLRERVEIIFKGIAVPAELAVPKAGRPDNPGVSMLHFIGPGDPPIFAYAFWPDLPPKDQTQLSHHPRYGMEVKRRYDALGLRCEVRIAAGPRIDDEVAKAAGYVQMMEFFDSVMVPKNSPAR